MLLQEGINTLIQLLVVLIICLIVWAIAGRKKAGFFRWVGLYLPTARSMGTAFLIFVVWSVLTTWLYFWGPLREAASGENTVVGALVTRGFDVETIAIILLLAGVKTALTEEIFFRGLVGKRLVNALGFWPGNTLQALIFGSIHLLIFAIPGGPEPTVPLVAGFLLLPGGAGWLMGYANEKAGNGSIFPGWLIHALGNATSYPILAFLV